MKLTDQDVNAVVEEFVLLRVDDPLTSSSDLWKKAVNNVLPKGSVCRLTATLSREVEKRWSVFINSLAVEIPVIVERIVKEPINVEMELEKVPISSLMEITGRKLGMVLEGFANSKQITKFADAPKPEQPMRKKEIRVVVIGLLPDQQNNLMELYQGDFKLKFIDKDKSTKIPCTVDWVIIQRHTGHTWWNTAKDRFGKDRVLFAQGGISSVLDKLKEIEDKEKELSS